MKKLWIISAATCILAATVSAQEMDLSLRAYAIEKNHHAASGSSVNAPKSMSITDADLKHYSQQTRANFYADFGYIPITGWEVTNDFNKISFMDKGVQFTAFYDMDDELVGTISNISANDLPAHALDNIHKMYAGYTVGDAIFFDDNEQNETDMIYYGTKFDDEDKYFVELQNDKEKIVVQVNTLGGVSFFTKLK
jgi:hypothetical protein